MTHPLQPLHCLIFCFTADFLCTYQYLFLDEFIDVIQDNRVYLPCLYVSTG